MTFLAFVFLAVPRHVRWNRLAGQPHGIAPENSVTLTLWIGIYFYPKRDGKETGPQIQKHTTA